jgi:hypothetical protein
MKLSSWIIWIVGALLVIATIDTVQDPPAVNPGTALCKTAQSSDHVCDTVRPWRELPLSSTSLPSRWVSSRAGLIYRASARMIVTVLAADPSPPARWLVLTQS